MEFASLPHYNIERTPEGSYSFHTPSGIVYLIDFEKSKHFEAYPGSVYEISFWPKDNKRSKLDHQIRNTLFHIVSQVLIKDNTCGVVFVCDSSDKKQLVRKKLFDKWFQAANTNWFLKIDTELHIGENEIYYNSLIMKTDNPFKKQLMECYTDSIDLYSK